jgi:hypothetical protein
MFKFKKFNFRKKNSQALAVAEKPVDVEVSLPFFLMVGSLRDCSVKDAELFARGLAEKYITALQLGRINVVKDKTQDRIIYEIHEGGPMLSILDGVLANLGKSDLVCIELTNGNHVEIADVNGELFTLVYPSVEDGDLKPLSMDSLGVVKELTFTPIAQLCSKLSIPELYPERRTLIKAGGVLMAISFLALTIACLSLVVVKSGIFQSDKALLQAKQGYLSDVDNNPLSQLDRARFASEQAGRPLKFLKKDAKGWSWELETAAPKVANKPAEPSPPQEVNAALNTAPHSPSIASGLDPAPMPRPMPLSPIAGPTAPSASSFAPPPPPMASLK